MNLEQVKLQMQLENMPDLPANHPIVNGRFNRYGKGKKAWYKLSEITLRSGRTIISGSFGLWQGQEANAVRVMQDWEGVSDEDRADAQRKQAEHEAAEAEKLRRIAEMAANRARRQWDAATSVTGPEASPYLQRKAVDGYGLRVDGAGVVLVPVRKYALTGAKIVALQKIMPDGEKRFNKGVAMVGAGCLLGTIDAATPIIGIGEGYATGRTVQLAAPAELPVMVAFNAGNLLAVADQLRRDFPDAHLLFFADDDAAPGRLEERFLAMLVKEFKVPALPAIDGSDHRATADDGATVEMRAYWREDATGTPYIEADVRSGRRIQSWKFENAGVSRALAAAKAVGNASVAIPQFGPGRDTSWSDYNDLYVHESPDAVRAQVAAALNLAQGQPQAAEPEPHSAQILQFPPSPLEEEAAVGQAGYGITADEAMAAHAEAHSAAGPDAAAPGGGGRKPKKEYGERHWTMVEELLDHFVLIYGDDTCWDGRNRMILKVKNLKIAYGNDPVKFWLANPDRRMVNRDAVVFDPTMRVDPETTVNLFDGFKVQPRPGKCSKILDLLGHLCNEDQDVLLWVTSWLAYPLQNPGAKMRTSIIIHGDEGSGKNLFFEDCVAKIYGEYGGVIGNAQIESPFNEWASKKLFLVADEVVTRNELRQLKGKIKHMVTGGTIRINTKGLSEREEANHMNFVFLSNEMQPLALDKTDRRYLVLWTPPKKPEEFYKEVAAEIYNGGMEAFYNFLLEFPLGDFNEHTKPLVTEAKANLISLGLSPAERFYREWSNGFLPLPHVCCSAMQLYAAFCRWSHLNGERFPASQTMFGRTIGRIAAGELSVQPVKYELGEEVRQRTVYLVGSQPKDKDRSVWVKDASELFEKALRKYRHVYDDPPEEEPSIR